MVLSLTAVREQIAEALRPAHFFAGRRIGLEWGHTPRETVSWEIFQGRLLDARQTRQRESFESWNVYLLDAEGRSGEPLISVKLDSRGECIYVTRAVHTYGWEGYDAGDNVILSRETRRWVRELAAIIELAQVQSESQLRKAVSHGVYQSVVGVSRLPLTSIEAPLPAFSLGELAYFHQADASAAPMRSYRDLLERALTAERPWQEQARVLETLLRSTQVEDLEAATRLFAACWQATGHAVSEAPRLLQTVFNGVALSPYTDFSDRAFAFLALLEAHHGLTAAQHVDFLGALVRQLGRHLTAYDLVTFHHRGANYPDALLLDAALHTLFDQAERHPRLFLRGTADEPASRLRRRALRQGHLLRARYHGHLVPDLPTSPGENSRVLPPPFARVPEEQILDPEKRQRSLFSEDVWHENLTPVGKQLLAEAVLDLEYPTELRELGLALFLDRPLGIFKRPGEPDQTPLLSYVAFSVSVAERRLPSNQDREALSARLRSMGQGLPVESRRQPVRPGVASLADALKVAPDFVLLHTTRRSAQDFFACFDLTPLARQCSLDWLAKRPVLIVGGAFVEGKTAGTLCVFDDAFQLRLELEIDVQAGYVTTEQGEFPAGGLRLLRVWKDGQPSDVADQNIRLRPPDQMASLDSNPGSIG
ncbi:MAG: hypothetical protein K2R98_26055 [Gemmataceae bacterium]|nr:hypothetical protein [Gemmataceae bacterium]